MIEHVSVPISATRLYQVAGERAVVDTARVKELVRLHWNRRAADFDLEASHGLLTDAQARAWRRLIADIAGSAPLDVLDIGLPHQQNDSGLRGANLEHQSVHFTASKSCGKITPPITQIQHEEMNLLFWLYSIW